MLERELKLHVPGRRQAKLEQELLGLNATSLPLHACYFDTEKHELAKAKIALRLRKEGDQWVQTIKAPGPDELSRVEINHKRPEPTLDLSLYQGSALESIMAQLQGTLQLRYETVINRLVLKKASETGVVELAYDTGLIRAGTLEWPISELELELISGDTSQLFTLARQWLEKHKLILDLRSKAERGEILARLVAKGEALAPQTHANDPMRRARRAGSINLADATSLDAAYRLCANDCMNQIIRNACFLAGVDASASARGLQVEYLHQLRVGMRRIRSCWKFFGKWLAFDGNSLSAHLQSYFSQLGETRDGDIIELAITPRLLQAGMPEIIWHAPPRHADQTQALTASAEFQLTLLTLMEHLVAVDTSTQGTLVSALTRQAGGEAGNQGTDNNDASQKTLGKALSRQLNKHLKRLCRQGAQFDQLSVEERHSLRKRIKGLRYSTEFSASLLSAKSLTRLLPALEALQHTLGELNDFYLAHDFYTAMADEQTAALFATGWLSAMQEQKITQAQAEFICLEKAGRFKRRKRMNVGLRATR
ncbi:CYTH and CHAD domain-containing protein [Alcaligenaceae bacterium]|nr:CYTH and CHAD domain-containing protein [Alcaligenaceae bacterium]